MHDTNVHIQIARLLPHAHSPQIAWMNVGPYLFRDWYPTTSFVEFHNLS